MAVQKSCFVIMPFRPEFNYFFLYLRHHLEEAHNINCFRGDNDVLTIPLLEKIRKYIEFADVLIADCTGRNPNVFYELGIAHTLNKKVILISMDDVKEAPADIRHYEFIQYNLQNHEEFLSRLDNALTNVFVENYEHLYNKAIEMLQQFCRDISSTAQPVRRDLFIAKLIKAESKQPIPDMADERKLKQYLTPLVIDTSIDFEIMERMVKWLTRD